MRFRLSAFKKVFVVDPVRRARIVEDNFGRMLRQVIVRECRIAYQKKYLQKNSNYNQVQIVVNKLGKDHETVKANKAEDKVAEFKALMEKIEHIPDLSKSWTSNSWKASFKETQELLTRAASMDEHFTQLIRILKGVRGNDVVLTATERRKLAIHIRRVCGDGALPNQGLPKSIAPGRRAWVSPIRIMMKTYT